MECASMKPLSRLALASGCVAFVLSAVPGLSPSPDAVVAAPAVNFALVGGLVIDGTGAAAQAGCTVLVEGGRIAAVGPDVEVPPGTERVDVTGKSVIPGMVDMHGHLFANVGGSIKSQFRPYSRLYLAGGVTSVFSPGEYEPEKALEFRDRQRRGEEVGTRIFTAGPYFDHDPSQVAWIEGVASKEQALEKLRQWKDRIDGVKVYTSITEDEFVAIEAEAHEAGLRITGHLGSLSAGRAVELGIDGLEHGIFAMSELVGPPSTQMFDTAYMRKLSTVDWKSPKLDALVQAIAERKVALDPTTAIFQSAYGNGPPVTEDWRRFLGPEVVKRIEAQNQSMATMRRRVLGDGDGEAEWHEAVAAAFEKQGELVKAVHEKGGLIVAGTDPVAADLIPGYGLHREARNLFEAGLSPLEVIRACTLNGAIAMRKEKELGSIEVGKFADLVVLDSDPTEDIAALGTTALVIQGGVRYDPEELRKSVEHGIR